VAALALVFVGTVTALYARERHALTWRLPRLPDGVSYVEETRTPDTYARDGYLELVSAVRAPTTPDHAARINVFLKLPAASRIRVIDQPSGYTLAMPAGAVALRVESAGNGDIDSPPSASWRVLDVRGTWFHEQGESFLVERPTVPMGAELLGLRWSRSASQAEPTRALGDLVRGGLVASSGRPDAAAAHLEALNDCSGCHVHGRKARTRTTEPGVVNRGADASGLFQPMSVLQDEVPIETYRPTDANAGRPFLTRMCGDHRATTDRCQDGSVMTARLDVGAGMRAHDPHTMRVCASRLALAGMLDHVNAAIGAAVEECTRR
jgi:hypothetical protein